nr:nucleosome assembly protein 1;2-like [Ipomoea batatas]
MWIREDKCKEIAVNSWSRTLGLDVLDHIKNKHDEFEVEYSKEKAALDAKYHKIYYPLYQQVKVMTEYKTWGLEETRTEESHPSGCGAVRGSLQL